MGQKRETPLEGKGLKLAFGIEYLGSFSLIFPYFSIRFIRTKRVFFAFSSKIKACYEAATSSPKKLLELNFKARANELIFRLGLERGTLSFLFVYVRNSKVKKRGAHVGKHRF